MKTHNKNLLVALAAMAMIGGAAQSATISADFEPTTATPAGWAIVGTGITVDTNGNPGNALEVAPGDGYLVNSGVAFDATQAFSGTFDFRVSENGNRSDLRVYIGDVQNGLGGAAGEYLDIDLQERTFGDRANIFDGDGATLFSGAGNNLYRIDTTIWINADFTWTPTSGTTGDFSITWDGPSPTGAGRGPMTAIGYTFTDNEVFFAFGNDAGSGLSGGQFDNISITGTEVPEPGSLALLGLGGLLIARRRRG